MMVVEHAERFGLSQLHQLRGRIGRVGSGVQGKCWLILGESAGDEAEMRARALERTDDGFKIAEEDMKIRGIGEVLGTRQHGLSDLKVADLIKDSRFVVFARDEAQKVLFDDGYVPEWEKEVLVKHIKHTIGERIDMVSAG
jgi:ATP-dependent DNA helicase RecG